MATEDPIYEKAKMVARATDKLCIANLQRHLAIGYNRAARLMEAMIEDGVVERYDTEYGGIRYRLVVPNV